ncbi:MAG TPA: hypothetical protein VN033_07140 [Vulgatibacter sp.]|nr:hypothetical protein [Vulgatibacter sp.]
MPSRSPRIKVPSRLATASLAAARPLAGVTHAATLAWDGSLAIRGASGATSFVFGHAHKAMRGRRLSEFFERTDVLEDALAFGTSRPMRLKTGQRVRVEAGPCPGGAVAVVRRPSGDELELDDLASALAHELRNAFSSVMLAVRSLARGDEIASPRGRRRLQLAERELRRIECVLRGLPEVGRGRAARRVEAIPERLVAEARENLGPLASDRLEISLPTGEGPAAQLDSPRICLAIEEMLRYGAKRVSTEGKVVVRVERRAAELAIVVETGTDAAVIPADGTPDIGLAVIRGVARAHGGHAELARCEGGFRLGLVIPQRQAAP